jgi:hypothetical protein
MDHEEEVKRVTARSKDMYDSGGGSGGGCTGKARLHKERAEAAAGTLPQTIVD